MSWDFFGDIGSTIGDGLSSAWSTTKSIMGNENLGNTLKGVGALGSAYGAYANAKATEDAAQMNYAMQNRLLNYEMAQAAEEKQRMNQAQDALDSGFAGLQFGTSKKKKDPLALAYEPTATT